MFPRLFQDSGRGLNVTPPRSTFSTYRVSESRFRPFLEDSHPWDYVLAQQGQLTFGFVRFGRNSEKHSTGVLPIIRVLHVLSA